uniref:Uncharacterized protein n=1 Tax=Tanacetum cinerariifolium TaxID=118510 RepID=A0A6L2MAQ5_TANCI|nr:hypothetical protein [Tanacetum cinerariifolium]
MRIEQYIQLIDYSLWEVIENGTKRLEVKARSTLMMGIPNEHQLKFNSIKDAKSLLEAIKKRFCGNDATKKTQRNLLKQQYENFTASSFESLDQTFDGFKSLNKPDLDSISMDDLYNKLKVYEPEVKGVSSSSTQNMEFVSSSSNNNTKNNNEAINTAFRVTTAGTQVNAANSTNIDNLSDAIICAFLASQSNSSQLVNEDLEQIHPDDLEEIDLKWQMDMLTMGARRFLKNTGRKLNLNGNETVAFDKTKVMIRVTKLKKDLTMHLWHTPFQVLILSLEEFTSEPAIETLNAKTSEDVPKVVKKDNGAPIIEDWKSDDEDESVAFGGNFKRGKITGKVIIKTSELDFENVYFVKELKYNLFSVSKMYDKKNSVLFNDTECVVLSSDFKLIDENHVLLGVPRKNNMYSVDLKNIIPKRGLTCLFAKATSDESKLWHRRLGHLNFKTINKLVKENLVREAVSTACYVQNRVLVVKPHNKTPYALFHGEFGGKADEGFFVGYSLNSKEFRVFNIRTRIVEETLHIRVLKILIWLQQLFGKKVNEVSRQENECKDQEEKDSVNSTNRVNVVRSTINAASNEVNAVGRKSSIELPNDLDMPKLEDISIFEDKNEDVLVFRNKLDERGIVIRNKARLVAQGHTQEECIDYDEVFAPVAKIEAIRLLAYASFKDSVVYQMDVKSAFLYGKIYEEVYVCQPLGFEDPDFPDKVYKVEKALYGLHQAQRAWYKTVDPDSNRSFISLLKLLVILDKSKTTMIETLTIIYKDYAESNLYTPEEQ